MILVQREPFLGIAGEREERLHCENNYKYNYKHIDKYNYNGIIEVWKNRRISNEDYHICRY